MYGREIVKTLVGANPCGRPIGPGCFATLPLRCHKNINPYTPAARTTAATVHFDFD